MKRSPLATLVALGALLGVRDASAQTAPSPPPGSGDAVNRARADFERGVALFRQHDYDGALAEFVRAYELSHRATVLFNIAASYQALHRYGDAIPALHRYLDQTRNDATLAAQRADAERALHELEALVAHLHIRVAPAGATVRVDGQPARETNGDLIVGPGHHVVDASLSGYRDAQAEVMVASGDVREVSLRLAVEQASPAVASNSSAPAVIPNPTLSVSGVSAAATITVDGTVHPASERVVLTPGRHVVDVTASSMRPWHGEVTLARGDSRTLRVQLVPERNALPTRFFVGGAIATGVLAIGAATAGILTLTTNAEFQTRTQESPDVQELASRGRASAIAADTLTVAAVAAAAVTAYFLARTEFTPRASTAEIAVAPLRDGAAVTVGWRF